MRTRGHAPAIERAARLLGKGGNNGTVATRASPSSNLATTSEGYCIPR